MKAAMVAYVLQHRHNMFNHAAMTVKHYLDIMCRSLQELMETRSDEIYIRMKADYMRVLGGVEVRPEAVMPREERHLRNQIMEKLRAADPQFKPISKGEIAPACGDETAQVESLVADDGESVAFESAPELVDQDTAAGHEVDSALQESIMQDQDDSVVSKSSPVTSKHVKLLTPSSNELSDTELQSSSYPSKIMGNKFSVENPEYLDFAILKPLRTTKTLSKQEISLFLTCSLQSLILGRDCGATAL